MAVTFFLEAKVDFLEAEMERVKEVKDMLNEDRKAQQMTDSELVEELEPYLAHFRETNLELRVAKRQRRAFQADVEAEYTTMRRWQDNPEIDSEVLEDAYQTVMHARLSAGADECPRPQDCLEIQPVKVQAGRARSLLPPGSVNGTVWLCVVPYYTEALPIGESGSHCPEASSRGRTGPPVWGPKRCV
jgi:hypothetical protein